MTRLGALRIAAAAAAIITALLLQGVLVSPLATPVPVSLPAVLVAAVAMVDGPGVGMALGFSTGIIADLTSRHATGVLALAWLIVGLVCGLLATPLVAGGLAGLPPAPVRYVLARGVGVTALACTAATLAAQTFLVAVGQDGATLGASFAHVVPTFAGDALLALALVPLARFMLTHGHLRADATTAGSPPQTGGTTALAAQSAQGRTWLG
jgi:hypothetical protein